MSDIWRPNPSPEYEFELNPYESFMRRHLQHYGYYTGRNTNYRETVGVFDNWEKTYSYAVTSDSSDSEYDEGKEERDNKTQEELLRTTQLVYSNQQGKMVPKLREPRQLYGINSSEFGPQQATRWPSEIQVLNERIKHIPNLPQQPEPLYKQTGLEKTPMSRSSESQGRIVYQYEPIVGSFFLRSRVGGCRTGCAKVSVDLESDKDTTLLFESRFESGNLAKAVQISEYEYELWLRNDLYTNKHTQWYYFSVSNTRPNVTYRFTIVNLMKPDSLYNNGMKPLMYSEEAARGKNIGWVHQGSDIKYYRNNIKYGSAKWYYSLTWTCQFSHEGDTVYFAHSYPYTYSDLQDYLMDISNDPVKSKICKQRVMCRTLAGNMVYALTITSPSKNQEEYKRRKAVVITARVHPGESNSSWMMKGFMDYLMGNSADAKLLRDTFVFKIVPMLNPDGVIVGNYRCSLTGRDMNRNYKTMLKDSFPAVWHTKTMIRRLMEEREVIVYCDLHGHSRKQNVFIYGCENRGNSQRRLRERIFPVILGKNSPEKFSFESCKFKVQKSKEGTGRVVMWNMGIMNSYTMEATFCGSTLGKKKGFHFTSEDFEKMGFHFCDTLLDYCDPDSSKCDKILLELEDKMRAEILQHLKQREGEGAVRDLSEINLDEDYLSEVESSDGGSDSSLSDGLPAHLQMLADKFPQKKKRMKSKRERDKHRCHGAKDDGSGGGHGKKLSATPLSTADGQAETVRRPRSCYAAECRAKAEKAERDRVASAKPLKSAAETRCKQFKSRDERNNHGIPMFAQERIDDRNSKKSDQGYLEALTQAYMQQGALTKTDQQKEVPHFRYSGGAQPAPNLPVNVESMCPQHEQAFAAQYVASHLQQLKFPDDLVELQKPKQSKKKPVSAKSDQRATVPVTPVVPHGSVQVSTERRSSQRHLLEISAAAQRQQDLLQQQESRSREQREEVDSPIKQHPPPFDTLLERDQNYDFVKRGSLSQRSKPDLSKSGRVSSSTSVHSLQRGPSAKAMATVRWQDSLDANVILGPAEEENDLWQSNPGAVPNTGPASPLRTQTPGNNSEQPESKTGRGTPLQRSKARIYNDLNHPPSKAAYVPSRRTHSNVPKSTNECLNVNTSSSSAVSSRRLEPWSLSTDSWFQRQGRPRPREWSCESTATLHAQHSKSFASRLASLEQMLSTSQSAAGLQSPDSELRATYQSLLELRNSLMDPAQRANLSPTTGQFVEHIIRKTDAEIRDITTELQSMRGQTRQGSASPERQIQPRVLSVRGQLKNALQSTEIHPASAPSNYSSHSHGPVESPVIQTRSDTVLSRSSGGVWRQNYGSVPQGAPLVERIDQGVDSSDGEVLPPGERSQSPEKDGRRGSEEWDRQFARAGQRPGTRDPTGRYIYEDKRLGSSRRQGSSPTKISLMISRGHRDPETSYSGGQFHAYPLTRPTRPPLLRGAPKRR